MNTRGSTPSPWPWLAAAIAFSPALVDVARQAVATPRSTTPLVAALLLALSAWRERARETPRRGEGLLLLVLASAFELLGIIGGTSTLGRVSVPLAVVGMSRLLGHPPLRTALLSLWLVAIPVSLMEPVRAPIEHAAASFVAWVAGLAGAETIAVGPVVRVGARSFEMQARDAGLELASLLALLGWYGATLRGATLGASLRSAAKGALLAIPLQPLVLVAAALALPPLGPGAARWLLDSGLPALVILTALPLAEHRRRLAARTVPR